MPRIRAIIFDCYSTLIDIKTNERKEEIYYYLSRYLQYYGVQIDPERLKTALTLEREEFLRSRGETYGEIDLEIVFGNILKKEGLNNPFMAESCCRLLRVLSREKLQLFPDSIPVLEEMKQRGYPLGIVSDAQKVFCLAEGKMLGLNRFFDCIVMSTHFGFRKPDPRLFTIACTLLGIPPMESVYIGNDPETDLKGAQGVNMQTILLDREKKNESRQPKPDFYAKNLWEVLNWIKSSVQT